MGECKVGGGGGDCLIKLFGKTIPVPESGDGEKDAQHSGSTTTESTAQEHMHQDSVDPAPRPEVLDTEEDSAAMKSSSSSSGGVSGSPKEKLKKPDKILPCPRCSSMDTKFCYYNNYNVNQPRHFCKNCQRYWTAGGAMRNVPVGSGRRKNKNAATAAASHFLQRVGAALPIKTNGTVLSFSSDASGLDLTEQMLHLNDKLVPAARARNSDDPSIGSRVDGSSNGEDKNQTVEKPANGVQHPCINGGAMWPYGCAPSPAYYTTSIAIPFYSAAAYWGCMVPGAWGAPWLPQSQAASSCNNAASSASSAPTSLTAPGKHPREGDEEGDGRNGACKVWAPKTIRIDNADDVARSSIWSLLGTKGDKVRMDGVFEPKGEAKVSARSMVERLPLLQANPVALSRSATFQEGS